MAKNKAYRIRIGGELLEMLQEAVDVNGVSASKIICMAVRLAQKEKPTVVVDKKNRDDHRTGDYGKVIKIYGMKAGAFKAGEIRQWLEWYLNRKPEQSDAELKAQEEIFLRYHAAMVAEAEAAIRQEVFAEPFESRIEYWRQRRADGDI